MVIGLYDILIFLCVMALGIILLGFIIYKSFSKIESWEDGIKSIFLFLRDVFYEEFTGKPLPENRINYDLVLNRQQISELKKMFENAPYISPFMEEKPMVIDGVVTFTINALGLSSDYKNVDINILSVLCKSMVKEYFLEFAREEDIFVVVTVCTPTMLRFKLPLNEIARARLIKADDMITSRKNSALDSEEVVELLEDNV